MIGESGENKKTTLKKPVVLEEGRGREREEEERERGGKEREGGIVVCTSERVEARAT